METLDEYMRFTVVPVKRLVHSDYTANKVPRGCMTHWALPWRALRRLGFSCCWYHGGDWRKVCHVAIRALSEAQDQGLEDDLEIIRFVRAHPSVRALSKWQREALDSLFIDPIKPPDGEDKFYVNGRHRARGIRDAAVKRAVVGEWIVVDPNA